jgi:uncharacterized protein (TIGR02246 family)
LTGSSALRHRRVGVVHRKEAVAAARAGDSERLDRLRHAHVAALNNGDVEAWVACFAPDGVQMAPNHPANLGPEAIRAWSGGLLAAFDAEFSLSAEEVRSTGADWAFERGTYTIALTPRGGGDPIRDAGKYITLYQRQPGGAWLVARDIWNSDIPLPVPR